MKKYLFFIAAGVLGLYSCSELEPEKIDAPLSSSSTLSIPITSENVISEPLTKSYLDDQEDGWSFLWEDGDHLGYFQYRVGLLQNQSLAEVDKSPSYTNVNYPAGDFKTGDMIYSYFYQTDAEGELASNGISNTDPNNLYLQIPTVQITTSEPETYEYELDYSFTLTNVSAKVGVSNSYDLVGTDDPVGTVPPSATLSFKMIGFKPDLTYRVSDNASNLSIDAYGNATATVSFDPVVSNNNRYTSTSNVSIYIDGYEDFCTTIPVTSTVSVTKGQTIPVLNIVLRQPKLTYTYTCGTASGSMVPITLTDIGDAKPYPVRNCMPIVSKHHTITSTEVRYPEDIQQSMTMYMLGSAVEFRCYSLSNSVAVGETLMGVMFSSTGEPCAGMCTYDLIGESLQLENMSSYDISAFDLDGKTLCYGKENYVSLYMILAPGSYPATVTFITDRNAYIFDMAEKTFSRAVMKSINCNFASSSCLVIPLEQYNPAPDDESTLEDEIDEM